MAEVGSFTSRAQAEMAAGMLGAEGIVARVLGDDGGGAVPHIAIGAHGYRLAVADEDVADAEVMLRGVDDDTVDADVDTTPVQVAVLNRKQVVRVAAAVLLVVILVGILMSELA